MSVYGLLSALAGFVKVHHVIVKPDIDDIIFRCHYKKTTVILFVFCIILTANKLIGDPISCVTETDIPSYVINTFCWITNTFTLPGSHGNVIGEEFGVPNGLDNDKQEKIYHAYYQWVPFMLFLQAILFYAPHWLWKNWEGGKIRMITDGLREVLKSSIVDRLTRQKRVTKYMHDSIGMHNAYWYHYFVCEMLNFINVVGNMFFVDKFLGNVFWTYGLKVITFLYADEENRFDPMMEVFPRVTKCTFHKYGPSGMIEKHDALCVLALNILNEKIYIFLWFWLIILAWLSAYAIVESTFVVMMPSYRKKLIKKIFAAATPTEIETLCRNIQVGDFLVLRLLSQNINVDSLTDILRGLCQEISKNEEDQEAQ